MRAELIGQYTNNSQLARVFTENWIAQNGYCLACESDRILATKANTKARDFECNRCGHPYELKGSQKAFASTVVDGAYRSMIRRIESNTVASLLLMRYSLATQLPTDLLVVHRSLITREVIQQRKPLAITARRAGWIGCNILLSGIPPEGRIPLIVNSIEIRREASRAKFQATEQLASRSAAERSWSRAVLNCLHRLPNRTFNLSDVYSFETELGVLFPMNRHVRPKIRQQLQFLRAAGLVTSDTRGHYELVSRQAGGGDPHAI